MTFSITARCPRTGMFGVAVTSSSPSVASRCAWARPGVGAGRPQYAARYSIQMMLSEKWVSS